MNLIAKLETLKSNKESKLKRNVYYLIPRLFQKLLRLFVLKGNTDLLLRNSEYTIGKRDI